MIFNLVAFCVLYLCFDGTSTEFILPKNPYKPISLPANTTKNVLIIGGGLAGLSAALELSDRGYQVTIKEKKDVIGGKLLSRPIEVYDKKTFQVEHGFHAWYYNYHQFHDIIKRLKIDKNFKKWEKAHMVFKKYKPEAIYSEGKYPFNLLGIVHRSQNLKYVDAFSSVKSFLEMVYFDYNTVYERFDNISFPEWCESYKVNKKLLDLMYMPALSVTFNEPDKISAAEVLVFIHMYFLSSPKADNRVFTRVNSFEAVLKPWADHLLKQNAKILINHTVFALKINESDLSVYGTSEDEQVYDHVIIASDIKHTQQLLENTLRNYKNNHKIKNAIEVSYNNTIAKITIAPPYKVIRIWFDKQLNDSVPDIIATPDFDSLNLIAQYSKIHKEYIEWANETGGSVVEFHCYTWNKHFDVNVSDEKVWGLIAPTVKTILPEIFDRNFKILGQTVNSLQDFSSFESGLAKYRPYSDSINSLKNVYLAGDWIRTKYVAQLMEKAVSTGREAANHVLLKDGVRQATMKVTSSKGPGLFGNT